MSTIATSAPYTPEDLLRLDREGLFELVGGQLVEKQMSQIAGRCAVRICQVL
jgi:hypothetical protein